MATFDAGRKAEMYQFFTVAFGAAPGATYWGQLREAVESGMSTLDIVKVFTSKAQFLSLYPESLSPQVFAQRLIDNVVKTSATAEAKQLAASQIVEALESGLTRGEAIYHLFNNLAARATDPAQPGYDPADPFVGVARQLANQVKVAQHYTEVLKADSDSLDTLQSIISGVTPQTDVSTPAKLQALVGPLLFDAGRKAEMYQFFSVAFGAAPGTTYWGQLQEAVESGMSTLDIVKVFTSKAQFLSIYPNSLSPQVFAQRLIDNVVKTSATPQAKALAASQIVEALESGMSRGEAIYHLFSNLAGRETNPAQPGYNAADPFVGVAQLLANQVKVAQYYTEVMEGSSDLLATLQRILASVTAQTDVSTPAKLKAIVDAALAPPPAPVEPPAPAPAPEPEPEPEPAPATFTVTIGLANQSPAFTEMAGLDDGTHALLINSAITFAGSGTVSLASVTIANTKPGDELLFTDTFKIAGAVTTNASGNRVLTLSGKPGLTVDNADFEAALESVRFNNTSDTPDTTARTIEFRVGNGTSTSPVATETVTVTATNDAPVLTLTAGAPVVEGALATADGLVVATYTGTDPDGNAIALDFTAGSNAAGYYWLNTVSREVTLTAAGAAFVNGGGTLPAISLTATDNGVPSESSTRAVTPVTTQVNDAPVIDAQAAVLTYTENDAPTVIAGATAVSDIDSADFNGGSLTVAFAANGTAADQLAVRNEGSGDGQIGVSGSTITFGGVAIGTLTGGTDGADLVVSFNSAAATPAAVQALARAITFANTSDNPSTSARSVRFTLVDGDGTAAGGSDTGSTTATVTVTSVNDAPVLTLTAAAPVVEDAPATADGLVVATYTVTDPEGNAITVDFTAGSNAAGYYALNTVNREVTLTAAGAAFVNGGGTLPAISLTATDDGVPNESSTQTVTPVTTQVNDAPVVDAHGASLAYVENGAASAIAPGITVTDVDSTDFDGGLLTVGFGGTGTGNDQLSVLNQGAGAGQIGVAGADISYEGTVIGTVAGGANGADLVISLNSAATVAAVQALARAIAFANSSDNPSTSARSVSFTLVDGDGTAAGGSDTGSTTATVTVASVNDAPVLVPGLGNTPYTEAGGAVVVDGWLDLSDVDSSTLASATVQITGGYQSGSDTLAFVGSGLTGNIAVGAFDVGTGTLTLTSAGGTATVAQWQEALRLVRFDSSSASPGASRVISFQVDDGDGGASLSTVQTKTIDIAEVNSAPTLTGGGVAAFTEGGGAVMLDGTLIVADPDTPVLAGATVSITAGFEAGQDVLVFTPVGTITGNYNSATGVLSMSGSGTPAQYQQALRSVAYNNTSDTPSTAPRTIAFEVNDGQGVSNLSNTTTVTLNVYATNDAPVVNGGGTLGYVEGGAAAAISPLLTVTDVDSANFAGGTLTVGFSANGTTDDQLGILHMGTGPGQIGVSGTDVAFGGVNIGTFSGGANGASLVVTLNSAATPAAVQALARAVTFSNSSVAPSTAPRTVTYTVVDGDGGTDTGSATATVNVTAVNDAPAIDAQAAALAYTENAAPTVIAGATTVSDTDSADFNGGSLTVAFTANGTAADQLAVRHEGAGAGQIGVSGSTITFGGVAIGSFTGGTNGTDLVISFNSAAATPAAVQALARNITFANTSDAPSTLERTVRFTVVDGDGGTQSASTTATVNVTAVNDAPVVGGGGTLAYTENGAAAAISPGGTITDPDSADFNGGSLMVGLGGTASAADQLSVIHQGTGAGQIGVSGTDVSFGSANIGTVTGGTNGGDLVVTFTTADATPAAVQALMRAISYRNDSEAPSTTARTVTYIVTDGDGGMQTGSATVNVTAVNDAPVTVVPLSSALATAMSNVDFAVAGVSISDVDAGSSNVQTIVTVTNGVATFNLAGGATVAAGANGSASVTLQGTVAQVNAALSTFTFKGADGLAAPTTATVSVITSDLGNTGTGGVLQSNGGVASTFQIGVIPQVFVIDNSTAVADDASAGSVANPFNTIANFNTLASDGVNDYIYLKHGTGTYSEASGFTLLAGQRLMGEGESLSFTNPVTGEVVGFGTGAGGTTPTVSITGAGNKAVSLATNNTLKGLNLATTVGSQTALADGGGTVGTLTVSNVDISGNGMAVDIDQGGVLDVTINSLTSTGSLQQGVQLAATGAALTGTFTAATGSISGATGVSFLVGDGAGTANTGGAVAITYGGTITASGSAAAVSIEDRVSGAGSVTLSGNIDRAVGSAPAVNIADIAAGAVVNFSGNLGINTTSGTGIAVNNNSGAVSFTGGQVAVSTSSGAGVSITGGTGATSFNLTGNGLDIVTTAGGTGFYAANAGTITVQGGGNTIAATGGVGLNVTNSTIGAAGLKFVSINSSNASSGIVLNNTGAQGGLTVTGSGTAASGGTLSGATGSAAIVASNTQDLNLAWMTIQNSTGYGIDATNLRGVNTLSNSTITGFGTGAGNLEDGFRIVNNNANMTSLTVTNTTFSNAGSANDGLFVEAQGTSSMAVSVIGSQFTQFYGDAIQVNGVTGSSGVVKLEVMFSDFTNAVASGNGGIAMNAFGNVGFIADINSNSFNGVLNNVVTTGAIGITSGGTATTDITVRNNDLDNIIGGRGITATVDGGHTELMFADNTIDSLGSASKYAISVNSTNNGAAVGNVDVTIQNNQIGQAGALWTAGTSSAEAVFLTNSNGASMDALVTNNQITANAGVEVVRARAGGSGVLNATFTNNNITDTDGSHLELAGTAGTTDGWGNLNLSFSGNVLAGGATGVIQITESGSSTVKVQQASALGVTSDNLSASVTVSGSPDFAAAAPTLPSTPSLPLLALRDAAGAAEPQGVLVSTDLQAMAEAAVARWVAAGIDAAQRQLLESVSFGVADLQGPILGLSTTGLVLVDSNAAGWGWFVDATPMLDEEFADPVHVAGEAGARVDLLTVLVHELGHVLGLEDQYGGDSSVMAGHLDSGQRLMPDMLLMGVAPASFGEGA
ncbi:MAG: hypothetical protein AB7E12_07255 [Burkholderiaceae bacterium]